VRECTTPASAATGYTVVSKQAVSFTSPAGPMMLARFDDSNPAGPGTPDDLRARAFSYHAGYSGVMGYVRGTGQYTISTSKHSSTALSSLALFGNVEVGNAVSGTGIPANTYVTVWTDASNVTINNAATDSLTSNLVFTINGTSQREGLWLCSNRGGPDFRQIPYIRTYTSEMPGKLAGDLWMQLSGTPVSSVYPTAQFRWYDGTTWQPPLNRTIGTAAGDIIKYTASDTPARLAIGAAGQVLTVVAGAPAWTAMGTGATNVGQATAAFASYLTEDTIAVAGQAALLAGSSINASIYADNDDVLAQDWYPVVVKSVVAGTGFTLSLRPHVGTFKGNVKINWQWA